MTKNLKTAFMIGTTLLTMVAWGVSFNDMKLNQEMNLNSLDTMNSNLSSTNGVLRIKSPDSDQDTLQSVHAQEVNGITYDIYDDGQLCIYFQDCDLVGDPLERIIINDKTLAQHIDEKISAVVGWSDIGAINDIVKNMVEQRVYNPLWGKTLAVVGDSLISVPDASTSYPAFIARRNNMTLVHKGVPGQRLCEDYTNNLGQVTLPSLIHTYTNYIPANADFILCQIGANDMGKWNTEAGQNIPDTDLSLDTFKGCWNNLLIGLKTNYPNAKLGMILPNNWIENLGYKTEDVIASNSKRDMTQWQKIQCQRLNIPVFDPVEDTRQFSYRFTQYPAQPQQQVEDLDLDWYDRKKIEIGTAQVEYNINQGKWLFQTPYLQDGHHTTEKGNLFLSFFYENWMKTALMCQ